MRRWWCRLRGHPLKTRLLETERTEGRTTAALYYDVCRCRRRRELLHRNVLQFPRQR